MTHPRFTRVALWNLLAVATLLLLLPSSPPVHGEERSGDTSNAGPDRTAIALEGLRRLQGVDINQSPALQAAVATVLESIRGRAEFVEIVRQFNIKDQNPALLEIAAANPTESFGVEAIRLILDAEDRQILVKALEPGDEETAIRVARALGNTADNRAVVFLGALLTEKEGGSGLQREAVRSLSQTREGASLLLEWVENEKLPEALKWTAASELNHSRWPEIKARAERLLPLAATGGTEVLPPVSQLLTMEGDLERGAKVLARPASACLVCHQVKGEGIDFGPNLSEIGNKLGKDALYEKIINPNSGIAFGYEGVLLRLESGNEAFGIIISETAEEVTIKAMGGIVSRHRKSVIVERQVNRTTSLMPPALHRSMSTQELVDLVEYLASLGR